MSGLLDVLVKSGAMGNVASMVAKNPQVLAAAAELLSSQAGSIGGTGGLGGLVGAFSKGGLGAGDAGNVLASLLPGLVNHATPQGQLPEASALEGLLGSLLGGK